VFGFVYTETVVHVPPEELAARAPYQVVMVERLDGGRVTGRSAAGERLRIGDAVERAGEEDGVALFRLFVPA